MFKNEFLIFNVNLIRYYTVVFQCLYSVNCFNTVSTLEDMKKQELKDYSWVVRGSQRKAVLMVMERMMTPTEIYGQAKKVNPNITLNNTSDVLREFKIHHIAECLNPNEKTGRLYALTKKGKKVKEELR